MKIEFEQSLTVEKVLSLFNYSNGNLCVKHNTTRKKAGEKAGWVNHAGYRMVQIQRQNIFAHRLIYLIFNGPFKGAIDHRDNNKSNNRIENLRLANKSQNACNTYLREDNVSGCKGVWFDKSRDQWCAEIMKNGKKIHIGRFNDLHEATVGINTVRNLLHDEFANAGCTPPVGGSS